MPQHAKAKPLNCDHGRHRKAIVQSLLGEIFQGNLRADQRLVTQELAERFGVSHTPVREALIELSGLGIIDLLPNRGAAVRRVTAGVVKEICQVRRLLECEAARNACGRTDPAELERLDRELRALIDAPSRSPAELIARARVADSRLHDLVAESCGNAFLANELSRLKILFRAFRDVAYTCDHERIASGRFTAEAREHLAIVQAIASEDADAAANAMAFHISQAVDYWGRTALNEASASSFTPSNPQGNPPR